MIEKTLIIKGRAANDKLNTWDQWEIFVTPMHSCTVHCKGNEILIIILPCRILAIVRMTLLSTGHQQFNIVTPYLCTDATETFLFLQRSFLGAKYCLERRESFESSLDSSKEKRKMLYTRCWFGTATCQSLLARNAMIPRSWCVSNNK